MAINYLKAVRDGIALIKAGREALAEVKDAISDGKAAIDADDAAEMEALLQAERPENRAAFNNLNDAIVAYRTRHGG